VVLVHPGQGAIGLQAVGEIGIPASHQDQITVERAFAVDLGGPVERRVETVIRAQQIQRGAFVKSLVVEPA